MNQPTSLTGQRNLTSTYPIKQEHVERLLVNISIEVHNYLKKDQREHTGSGKTNVIGISCTLTYNDIKLFENGLNFLSY